MLIYFFLLVDIILSTREKQVDGQLWAAADKDNSGFITGADAVPFFAKSGLPPQVLGQVTRSFASDAFQEKMTLEANGHRQSTRKSTRKTVINRQSVIQNGIPPNR